MGSFSHRLTATRVLYVGVCGLQFLYFLVSRYAPALNGLSSTLCGSQTFSSLFLSEIQLHYPDRPKRGSEKS